MMQPNLISLMESMLTNSQPAAAALLSSIWQGAILAALVWLAIQIVPRMTAAIRFVLWSTAFVAVAILPVVSGVFHSGSGGAESTTLATPVPALLLDSRWALGIVAAWITFSGARIFGLIRNGARLRSLWNGSEPVEADSGVAQFLGKAGLRRAALCTSSEIDQPCVIGFFSPRILVPNWLLETATSAEIEQIVMHEVAHLRRFDDWTNLLQKLALACFPLNPALVWIERRLCSEREVACDERVVRATQAPREYATCLTNLAEQRTARHQSVALSLGAWERRSQLAGRVESILRGESGLSPLKARAIVAALALATTVGALKLGGSAELVAFTSPASFESFSAAGQPSQATGAGPHYKNVVFHGPSAPDTQILRTHPASAHPSKQPHVHQILKSSPRRANAPADGVESFIVVTRWQDNAGRQLTVIDRFVRISAFPTAPVQAGWFVVQL